MQGVLGGGYSIFLGHQSPRYGVGVGGGGDGIRSSNPSRCGRDERSEEVAARVNACVAAGRTDGGKAGRAGISEGAIDESRLVTPGRDASAWGLMTDPLPEFSCFRV